MERERLIAMIDRAIDLYQLCQPIKGMLPSPEKIRYMLKTCGVNVGLDIVRACREIAIDRRTGRQQ